MRWFKVGGAVLAMLAQVTAGAPPRVLQTLPDFALADQDGRAVSLESLRGRAWIANFIFTRCEATCPAQTRVLAEVQQATAAHPKRGQFRFVSITVDPSNDSASALKSYGGKLGADFSRWMFLTGSRDALVALSRDGFKLPVDDAKAATGIITHSPSFVLVDPLGRVRGLYEHSSAEEVKRMRADLDAVLAENIAVPVELFDDGWMEQRGAAQRAAAAGKVAHDFQFTDRSRESGITFRNRIVDCAGRNYKAVHYDHGTGLAVADVDGDELPDLFFVNQAAQNELWRNKGGGKFENITARAGVGLPGRICVGASFADVDNDGDADLYVTTVRNGNVLLRNDGSGKFADVSEESGLDVAAHSSGAVFFDYNRDGLVDLFLCNVGRYTSDASAPVARGEPQKYFTGLVDAFSGHLKPERSEQSILFENVGHGRFVDVSEKRKLVHTGWTGDAIAFDANADGWTDLFVLNMQGHNRLYENVRGESFVERTGTVFGKTPWGAMGVASLDADNDGKMDLYATDMHSDMSAAVGPDAEAKKSAVIWPESFLRSEGKSIFGNAFYRGLGAGKFEEASDRMNLENYWPWGASVGDVNADGFADLFVTCGMGYPFRYAGNKLMLNSGGARFFDAEFLTGVEPRRGGFVQPWFDLACSAEDRANRLCEGLTGNSTVWASKSSRSSALVDLDDDGDLDLVTNEFNAEPLVLVNDLAQRGQISFVKIRLRGTKSGRDGLGARVVVQAGGQTQTRVNDGKSGYLSQSSLPLHFGLGGAQGIESVTVTWSSGAKSEVKDVKLNTTLEISEP